MGNWITKLAPYVPLMQPLVWIGLIGIGTGLFFGQCRGILEAVRNRIERGSSIKAGPIELGEDLRNLEYVQPKPVDSVPKTALAVPTSEEYDWAKQRDGIYETSRGVFLAHVIEPSKEPGQVYDVSFIS